MASGLVTIFSIHTMRGWWRRASSTLVRNSEAISGVSGAPAQRTTCVSGGRKLMASSMRVGRSGAEDDLRFRRQEADGVDQVSYALLARNATDKQHVGYGRVDTVIEKSLGLGSPLVFG